MIKKWTESEIEILKTLLKEGKTYAEMSTVLGKTDRGIQHFIYKKNLLYNPLTQKKITNKTIPTPTTTIKIIKIVATTADIPLFFIIIQYNLD